MIYKGNVSSTQSEAVIIFLEDINSRGSIVVLISSPTNGLCNLLMAEMNGTGKPMCLEDDALCLSQCMKTMPGGLDDCIAQCLSYLYG